LNSLRYSFASGIAGRAAEEAAVRKQAKADGATSHWRGATIRTGFRRLITFITCAAVLAGLSPEPVRAQAPPPSPPASEGAEGQTFSVEQLDALLAPVALYPDDLLMQLLMASIYPLQVIEAARWVEEPANKALKGDALTQALNAKNWDPSVKSLVPFPQVLEMMNAKLDWLQQLGYAMMVQQAEVMDSIQRLRRQAQSAGNLQSTPQQVVRTEGTTVVIQPAQPDAVYVPTYNPSQVYGTWPYPSYPPASLPPPAGYYPGAVLATGLAFGAAAAVTAGLWGWARPNWGGGYADVNVNRYNSINANRAQITNSTWRAPGAARPGGIGMRPPAGPVGRPTARPPGGLPANAIGRGNVRVPGNVVRPPARVGQGSRAPISPATRPGGGQGLRQAGRPGAGQGVGRPGGGQEFGQANRPGGGQGLRQAGRSGAGQGAGRPGGGQRFGEANRPGGRQESGQRSRPSGGGGFGQADRFGGGGGSPGAFNRMNEGRSAGQFSNRGAQSRQASFQQRGGGGGGGGRSGGFGGARAGGGGGGGRGGGGGGRRR
jgi:Protein of unknown function (DUF3300)